MRAPSDDHVMSIEEECLTAVAGADAKSGIEVAHALSELLKEMANCGPSLPSRSGFFNGYGRAYIDTNLHFELAAAECDSPYVVPLIVERQHRLAARAVERVKAKGKRLILANNNHNGLMENGSPVWGTHENYLVDEHPRRFGNLILPFLVTRVYSGCGAIQYPSGVFLASARAQRMELESGGGTTESRAIHSTQREEHHMGPSPRQFRYHLIIGDGHRSQFNLALQLGATALTLKAILFDTDLPRRVSTIGGLKRCGSWLAALRKFNVLARPGQEPSVDRVAIETQRIYLDAARRYAESLGRAPEWISRILADWQDTLDAMERNDIDWLSARLDMFAKYRFLSRVLDQQDACWRSLQRRGNLFRELALLDHNYHEFCNPDSAFDRLDCAGLLNHRVGARIEPGSESEPWIPETKTRAQARARFISKNSRRPQVVVDWSYVDDHQRGERLFLFSPFAEAYTSLPPAGRPEMGW